VDEKKESFKNEYDEILDWAINEEDKIYKNSKDKGLDGNREEHKRIKKEMMDKIDKLKVKYNIIN